MRANTQTGIQADVALADREGRSRHVEAMISESSSGEGELAIFSYENEARSYLAHRSGSGWRVREVGAGELVSLLYGPCRHVKRVALDPSPKTAAMTTRKPVGVNRESFVNFLLRSGGGDSRFGGTHDGETKALVSD